MSTDHGDRTWLGPSAPERLNLLRQARSIAIVGASNKPSRASYFVTTYLLSSSPYELYFVNPAIDDVLGHRVYPSLQDLPVVPDVVDVFRKNDDVPAVLDDAIDVGERAEERADPGGDQGQHHAQHDPPASASVPRCVADLSAPLHDAGVDLAADDPVRCRPGRSRWALTRRTCSARRARRT